MKCGGGVHGACIGHSPSHGHHRQVTEYRRPRGTAVATRIPRRPTPPAHARSPQSRDLGPSRSLDQSPVATIRPATRSPHAAGHAVAGRVGGGRPTLAIGHRSNGKTTWGLINLSRLFLKRCNGTALAPAVSHPMPSLGGNQAA